MYKYIGLKGGHPYPTICPKLVQNIVEVDGFPQTSVKDNGNRLPYDLYKSNSAEILTPFGHQNGSFPCPFLGNLAVVELYLDELHHFYPVGDVCILLIPCLHLPFLQVLRLHYGGVSKPVGSEPFYTALDLLFLLHRGIHRKGVHHHRDVLPPGGGGGI